MRLIVYDKLSQLSQNSVIEHAIIKFNIVKDTQCPLQLLPFNIFVVISENIFIQESVLYYINFVNGGIEETVNTVSADTPTREMVLS